MMKTAVTVLQEMMIKMGQVPEYECISQSGPQHQATFEYRCVAHGVSVTGRARSKKEAKQEAARRALQQLRARGLPVPPPYCAAPGPQDPRDPPDERASPEPGDRPALEAGASGATAASGALDTRSYVALLKELCEQYRLGDAQYALVADTGPAHLRRFSVRAALGLHARTATASTKKAARQLAAEQLYHYLRENLARLTTDFVEEEALARAVEKSMRRAHERATDALAAAQQRYAERERPDLTRRLAHYHLGLLAHLEEDSRLRALEAVAEDGTDAEEALERACDALGLRVERAQLPTGDAPLSVLSLAPSTPPLAFAAARPALAAAAALRYLRRALAAPHRTDPAAPLAPLALAC